MNYQEFVEALFELGQANGFEEMEVYYQKNGEFETTVFKAEVDKFSISEVAGLSFRGIISGKMGYAYTEVLDEKAILMLVEEAKSNAAVIESEDEVFIAAPHEKYGTVDAYSTSLKAVEKSDKIDFLKAVEAEVLAMDDRIKTLAYNLYADFETEVIIQNTKGLDLKQRHNLALGYVVAVASDGKDNKTGQMLIMDRDFKAFDAKAVAKNVVDKSLSMLGAKTIPSKTYPVILKNECAASLLAACHSIFNAEIVQKDLSLLKGCLEEQVASEFLTIVDDPLLKGGYGNISFDAEGTPAQQTTLIEKGVLKSYLHNLKTAKKDGVQSTGNAAKGSYKASVNIAPSNFVVQPGKHPYSELLARMTEGVVITKLDGLHAGLNTVSGDFSLAAMGYLVEDGRIVRPVDQITVAGNLKDLLLDVEAVGDDLRFGLPQGGTFIASPSIKIKKLAISGE